MIRDWRIWNIDKYSPSSPGRYYFLAIDIRSSVAFTIRKKKENMLYTFKTRFQIFHKTLAACEFRDTRR